MKKVLLATLVCIFAFTVNAYASIIMFDSVGTVDTNFNNSWNPVTLSGTARYYFTYDNPSVLAYWLSLQFEDDVFDLPQLNTSKVDIAAPWYWVDTMTTEPHFKYVTAAGLPITSTQDPIIIDVDYKLLGSPETLDWDEGQAWSQAYSMLGAGSLGSGVTLGLSGGSTAPIPEPASILLLGMGILGLFGLRKRG